MDQQETTMSTEQPKPLSLGMRIMNVFSAPSELYTEVASLPVQRSSWVVPYLLSMLLVLVFTFALFNNESLRNQIYDAQLEGMQKAVAEGQMTEAQMERAEDQMRSSGLAIFMLFGGVSQMVILSVMFFGAALFLWLAAKFALKANVGYGKMLEVMGLASWIGLLGAVVTLLLMYTLNSLHASPGLALAVVDSYDSHNTVHKALTQLNVFTLWETAVIGIALSRISGKPTATATGIAFMLWAIWSFIAVVLGFVR